jgi:hypothetical protein
MKYKIGDTVWVKITKPECGIYFNKDQCGYEGPGKIDDLELNQLGCDDDGVVGLEYRIIFPIFLGEQNTWWIHKENIIDKV